MRLCTIVTKDRLPWARVLAASWAQHHPQQPVTVLLVDEPDGCFDPAGEPFDVLAAADVAGPAFWALALRYEPFELAMALKPWLLMHELERHERVVYLDADVLVTAPLQPVVAALERYEIVLTPHLLDPIELDGKQPGEPDITKAGAYNGGFLALRRGEQSDRFLAWWAARLRTGSRVDVAAGMFVDQHWLDLVPGIFGAVGLLEDRGCNVAYWNLAERPLSERDGMLYAAAAPLRFFHFSGFDPCRPQRLSRYGTRAKCGADELLAGLCERYAALLESAALSDARRWPYSWASTGGGIALTPMLRSLLDLDGAPADSIFTAAGERAWLRWLNAPAEIGAADGVTRFLAALHASRADLRTRFSDLRGDSASYMRWVADRGIDELAIPPALHPPASSSEVASGLRDVGPEDELGLCRGEAVVCIPLYGAHDLFVRCLSSILAHTPRSVTILVADDAGPDPASRAFADDLANAGTLEHRLLWLRQERNRGFVANVNTVFALSAPADVVIVNSDCVVATGWFEGMRHAAYDDTNVATATALTNHGTIVSLPARNQPRSDLPQHLDFVAGARKVRATSQRLRPRIPTCVGHCFFVRREALDAVGPFDPAFSPAYGEEVDFSQRCTVHGFVHVVADDVLVLHRQGGSLSEDGVANRHQRPHDEIIAARYPFYERLVRASRDDEHGPLARALGSAGRALGNALTVTIDGRSLGPILTGTQLHVLELVGALARTGELRLRVVVPADLGDYAREPLASAGVELLGEGAAGSPDVQRSAVVHRPLQVSDARDLRLMAHLGERAVITQQDLIAYRNPGYFPGYPQFARYRSLARRALTFADAVVFFSHHAARHAVLEELVEPQRAQVAYIGVDHHTIAASSERRRPAGCDDLGERQVLLCLGTDFRHKNRLFALRVVEQLQLRHHWEGRLVLAGPRVQDGSSAGDEAAFLATRPSLARAVVRLPAIEEDEKAWLYEHATALLYPTLYEGFGLMPFEAAHFGIPALWSAQASLGEVLPPEAATLVAWDAAASADNAIAVLREPARAEELLLAVRRAAERFRWDSTARELVTIYDQTATRPAREARLLALETNELELERTELERKYAELLGGFTDDGRRLIGSDGLLSIEQQHALRSVLERKAPHTALVGALHAARRLRRTNRRPAPPETDADQLRLHWEWLNLNDLGEQLTATDPLVLGPELS
jgi:glycosyltransferase involved in cell wall biosynthesis/GT2 family glycosyltransferase